MKDILWELFGTKIVRGVLIGIMVIATFYGIVTRDAGNAVRFYFEKGTAIVGYILDWAIFDDFKESIKEITSPKGP